MASTVSVTGFSVALTGKSVALSVAPVSVFRPAQGLFASVCAAEFVNIYDHEIHVFRQVCNVIRQPYYLETTTITTRTTCYVV